MLRVALTGGMATGKSYVRTRLAARGVPSIDSDALVHDLLKPGTAVTRAIAARFGEAVIGADGGVNRPALGRVVFADAAARQALERIVHPEVYARIAAWMASQAAVGAAMAVADIPLLYETAHEGDFDCVIVAACDPEEQVRRAVTRGGLPEAEVRARLAAQWPIGRKAARADIVIRTDGSFAETDRQVDEAVRALGHLRGGVLRRDSP